MMPIIRDESAMAFRKRRRPLLTSLYQLFQLPFEDLAGGIPREIFDKKDLWGNLEMGNMAVKGMNHLILHVLPAFVQNDKGRHELAARLVGHGHRSRLPDLWKRQDGPSRFGGVDVFAGTDDQLLLFKSSRPVSPDI
jgi:hypothetical protein